MEGGREEEKDRTMEGGKNGRVTSKCSRREEGRKG